MYMLWRFVCVHASYYISLHMSIPYEFESYVVVIWESTDCILYTIAYVYSCLLLLEFGETVDMSCKVVLLQGNPMWHQIFVVSTPS